MIKDETEFHRNINNLSTGKKPGPDNIPNEILTTAPPLLKTCLHLLAQIFWATGCTQTDGKIATRSSSSRTKEPYWT
jgi:hypothetical protein